MNKSFSLLTAFFIFTSPCWAIEIPPLTGRVVDNASLLTSEEKQEITTIFGEHEKRTGNQIAVLTIPSLNGESLEEISLKVAETWKLGQKDKSNGVLFLIAKEDRKLRIEVGYGLEGDLTDAKSSQIIRKVVVPEFKQGQFGSGVVNGSKAIVGLLEKKHLSEVFPENSIVNDSLFSESTNFAEQGIMIVFVFLVLSIFTFYALVGPLFLYFFLIPFWSIFPMILVGTVVGKFVALTYILGLPILRFIFSRSGFGKKLMKSLASGSGGSYSGGTFYGGGSSGGFSSGGGGFSGGGGSFGGGGSSGSW